MLEPKSTMTYAADCIILDKNMSWQSHIDYLSSRLSKVCGIIYLIRNNLTIEAMLSIYYCLFYSILTYGINIWGGACLQYLDKIYLIQKRFIRAITYTKRSERTTPIFNRLNLLKFHNVRKLFLYVLGFKFFHQKYCCNIFDQPPQNINTRHNALLLLIPVSTCKAVTHSALFCVPRIWNEFITSSKALYTGSHNVFQFKSKIKNKLYAEQNS